MISLIATLAQSMFFRVEDRIEGAVARAKRNAVVFSIVGVLLLTAYVVAVVATCILLSARYGPIAGLFGLAGALAAVALVAIGPYRACSRTVSCAEEEAAPRPRRRLSGSIFPRF